MKQRSEHFGTKVAVTMGQKIGNISRYAHTGVLY